MRAEVIPGLPAAVGSAQADHILLTGDWPGSLLTCISGPGDLGGPDSVFFIKSSHAPLSPPLQNLS